MSNSVRCPACRGAQKVAKLGGMMGECNTCNGKGTILAVDKPVKVEITVEDVCAKELIDAVSDVTSVVALDIPVVKEQPKDEPKFKLEGKKAVFKHKTAK